MDDDEIRKFIDKNSDLFRRLSDGLLCPKCKKVVYGEKFNLGKDFNWAEGCRDCADDSQG